jgi:hypothetical protein
MVFRSLRVAAMLLPFRVSFMLCFGFFTPDDLSQDPMVITPNQKSVKMPKHNMKLTLNGKSIAATIKLLKNMLAAGKPVPMSVGGPVTMQIGDWKGTIQFAESFTTTLRAW